MSNDKKEVLKVILLGNGGVGKSSLMRRYVNDIFEEKTLHTIGVEFLNKNVSFNNTTFSLQIWDTGGQERFKSLRTPFYRGADICILVFDLTDKDSFIEIEYWVEEFKKYSDLEAARSPFLLLGNKADLPSHVVTSEEVYRWCKEHDSMPYLEVSAKLDLNVDKGFLMMVKRCLEFKEDKRDNNAMKNTLKLRRASSKQPKECCLKS